MVLEDFKGIWGWCRGDDDIPDDRFRIADLRIRLVGGRVGGVYVDKELFGVPVEQRAEVGVEVEAELRIFLALGRVIMRPSFDALIRVESALGHAYGYA